MPLLKNSDEISRYLHLDMFDYNGLPEHLVKTYSFYENKFNSLYEEYSEIWGLENCFFYIKNSNSCNASAIKINGYNLINITNGYPVLMERKFREELFRNQILVAIINEKNISDAYCQLHENQSFNIKEFMLECSIRFTFHHEFRHILQFNNSNARTNFNFQENLNTNTAFKMKKHAWEYDADRIATAKVLGFANDTKAILGYEEDNYLLKCILYIALSSIIITKNLFYFNVINDYSNASSVKIKEFYTKKFSHPHSLVRMINIISYFIDCANHRYPSLGFEYQEVINNVLGMNRLYFSSLTQDQSVLDDFFTEWKNNLNQINAYNNELYEFAIRNKPIKQLLLYTGADFGITSKSSS